jgi:hypothetical protein
MMPQFETFYYFYQHFWDFIAFSYLYLVLSFYVLPAFAAVLKIRSKKLAQLDISSSSSSLASGSATDLAFFDILSAKLGGIHFFRKNLNHEINSAYSSLLFKNEAFYNFNFLVLNQFKVATFFV